jgi:membrane-bound ClpP family serine protease
MRPKRSITTLLGLVLLLIGLYLLSQNRQSVRLVPCVIGASLIYLGYRPGRTAVIVFGHICVIVGCFLTTLGIYLAPYSQPTLAHIFGRPLFWGLFSIFGGLCALYHGFCRCVSASK